MGIKYDRFQISDIDPIILVRKLVIKSDKNIMSKEQSVLLSMIDFYQLYMDINLLEDQLIDVQFEVFDSLTEQASLAFSSLLGKNISPETIKVSAIQYYNHFLERKLKERKGLPINGSKRYWRPNY